MTKNVRPHCYDILTALSVVPALDTFTNLASIPVDIAKGDWLSAGLDLFGAIPFVGEVADTAKLGLKAGKVLDKMAEKTMSKTYKKNGFIIRFDVGETTARGYKRRDHYHILNPNSTGKHDCYLDNNGVPVPRNSKASHKKGVKNNEYWNFRSI